MEKIKVYYINSAGVYQDHFRLEDPSYQAKDGETTVPKPSLREPAVLENGAWRGATDEEYAAWVAAHPQKQTKPAEPSTQDKALNALGLQLAQVQKTQATQAQAINALGLQFAAAKSKDTKTENGGN